MRKKFLALLIISALTTTMIGCSNVESSDAATSSTQSGSGEFSGSSDDGVFNVAISADIDSFDPALCNAYETELVVNNVYDNLFKFDEDDSSLQPNLVESYEQPDDVTYVLKLREDVSFWDGNQMTAEDVVYSLTRHMDASVASLFAYMYYSVDTIEATGDYEVTITLLAPDTDFIYNLATMAGAVIEKSYAQEAGDTFGKATGGTMGTGPFKYDSWTEGSQIVLTKNDNYWRDVTYPEDTLEFDIIEDSATIALALTSGQVDFFNIPSLDMMNQMADSDEVDIFYAPGVQNTYLAFNCSKGPFSDPNVRKAVCCAIDREAISKATRGEGYYETAKAIDYNTDCFSYYNDDWAALNDDLDSYDYDVEKAKEYLAASDYPDGFECTFPVMSVQQKANEAVQYYLSQIGITVNLETVTTSDYYQYAYGVMLDEDGLRDYDAILFAWFPDYADPSAYLMIYSSANAGVGGSNLSAYMNDKVDSLYALAKTQDGDERNETLKEAYTKINEDCAACFINYFGPTAAVNSSYECNMPAMWFWDFDFTMVSKK